jgi:hypothetical protein
MGVMMIRAKVKDDRVVEVEAAAKAIVIDVASGS